MSRLIRAVIDTRALRSNLATIRAKVPGSKVMAVVKANGYGHGLIPIALSLAEADAFAVARLEEGLALRAAGVNQTIILLEGVFTPEQLQEAARHGFQIVVHDTLQIELLESFPGSHRFVLWLKMDTGMNRLGFRPEEYMSAFERIRKLTPPPLEVRLLTHLARADERDESMTRRQVDVFTTIVKKLGCVTSISNSAGIFGATDTRCDWVRPGLALYGASPFADQSAAELGLLPAMTFETAVIAIRNVPRGETVGYAGAWAAPRNSLIAIVAAGYGDGLLRSLPTGAPVLIDGRRAPLVGRVSMDMIAVDITDLQGPPVNLGARAILWGEGLPVEEVAAHAGTIPYELICGVRQRVPRELR